MPKHITPTIVSHVTALAGMVVPNGELRRHVEAKMLQAVEWRARSGTLPALDMNAVLMAANAAIYDYGVEGCE